MIVGVLPFDTDCGLLCILSDLYESRRRGAPASGAQMARTFPDDFARVVQQGHTDIVRISPYNHWA